MNRLPRLGIAVLLLLQTFAPTASAAPLSWQPQGSLPANQASTGALSVIYGKGQFLVTDRMAGTYTSSDAKAWTSHAPTPWISPLTFLNGRFLGGGNSGIGKYLAVSDDGLSWQAGVSWGPTPVMGVTYGKGRYLVGRFNGDPALISADLKTVSYSQTPMNGPMRGVAYGKGLFVGADNGLNYSADGLTWTEAVPPLGDLASGDAFGDVAYGGGRFVAVGVTGKATGSGTSVLYTSTDGKRWAQAPTDAANVFGAVTYGGGRFVAWGPKTLLTSEDGEHWTAEANANAATSIAYGAGKFVALGADRTVMAAAGCGSRFPDVAAGHSACDAVEALSRQQILSGYPDGAFRPGTAVTRAELAKMLTLARGLKPEPTGSLTFSDTAGHWAASSGYLQAAVTAGMINGFPDGTFRPNQPVTRAQAAKMVAAAAGLQPGSGAAYRDITGGDWFGGWVAAVRGADLVGAGGYHSLWAEQDFWGNAPADRGEAATLLDNLANN